MGRKRRLESIQKSGGASRLSMPHKNNGCYVVGLALLAVLLPRAVCQFTDCLETMALNDVNEDSLLTPKEFQHFIHDLSRGKISLLDVENPKQQQHHAAIHQSFHARVDPDLGGVNLSIGAGPQDANFLHLFCENVYDSFFPMFHVSVTGEECQAALRQSLSGDGQQQQLDVTGFTHVASLLLGDEFQPGDLGGVAWAVFSDFQDSNGVIKQASLLRARMSNMFCRRVVLGTRLDDRELTVDLGDTPVTTRMKFSQTELPSCLGELAQVAGSKDEMLSKGEYVALLNKLSSGTFLFETFDQLPLVLRNNYLWLCLDSQKVDIRGLGKEESSLVESESLLHLRWVCSLTEAALLSALQDPRDVHLNGDPFLTACIISTLESDRNSDGKLGFDEFRSLLSPTADDSRILDDDAVQRVVDGVQAMNDNNLRVSGLRGSLELSLEKLEGFETLCGVIQDGVGAPSFFSKEFPRVAALAGNSRYLEANWYQPTGPPQIVTTEDMLFLISPVELQRCKSYLLVSDTNRNSQVSEDEYVSFVNRLTLNAFLGVAYSDLPVFFRDIFEASREGAGYLSIIGARPNQGATPDQLAALESFCEGAYEAFDAWKDAETNEPTISPTGGSNPSGPTLPPTCVVSNFPFCTTSMAVSDRNQDTYLGEEEFVGFVNRMSQNMFLGLSFQEISPAVQVVFFNLRDDSGSINISGARPGQPRDEEETARLRRVCCETEKAISNLKTTSAPSSLPLSQPTTPPARSTLPPSPTGPTVAPSSAGPTLTPLQLGRCRGSLNAADTDKDKELTQAEFVRFLNLISGNAFRELGFSDLDVIFQQLFTTIQTDEETMRIPEQLAPLTFFCSRVYDAIETFNNKGTPTQAPTARGPPDDPAKDPVVRECLESLVIADSNADSALDQLEYVVLVSFMSDNVYDAVLPFPSLPYVVRDNFDWVRGQSSVIDIRGAGDIIQLNATTRVTELARVCRRTDQVVASSASGNNETEFDSHCYGSFAVSDRNDDNQLNQTEFAWMVRYFQGLDPSNSVFETLDDPFSNFFEANKETSSGRLNIEGSKPGDTPTVLQDLSLSYLCEEMSKAVEEAREIFLLMSRCSAALVHANENEDNFLTQTEYVGFVYSFAGRDAGNTSYTELPGALQLNFESLQSSDTASINIEGWRGGDLSPAENNNLKSVCTATEIAILTGFPLGAPTQTPTLAPSPTGESSVATIYNGILLKTREDLFVSDFGDSDIADLERAYKGFLNVSLVPFLPENRRLRKRRLAAISFSYSSPQVYKVEDGICPGEGSNTTNKCKEAYASFDLILSKGIDLNSTVEVYTTLTQDSIANGDLQAQLEKLVPDPRFDIIGTVDSVVRPDTRSPTASPMATQGTGTIAPTGSPALRNEEPRSDDDSGGGFAFMPVGVAIIGGVAILGCCCCCFFYIRRQGQQRNTVDAFFGKDQTGMSPKNDKEGNLTDDHEMSIDQSESETGNDMLGNASNDLLVPAASEHSRMEQNFNFSASEHDPMDSPGGGSTGVPSWSPQDVPDSPMDENLWSGAADNILGGSDGSEGSEESELVVRSAAISGSASRASRNSGRESGAPAPGYFDDSESSEGSMGLPESDGGFATDLEGDSQQGDGTFRDGDDSFERGSFGGDGDGSYGSYGDDYDGDDYGDDYDDQPHEPSYDNEEDGSAYRGSLVDEGHTEQDHSLEEDESIQDSYRISEDGMDRAERIMFREQIKTLVLKVVPDEVENVDAMMEQFYGREPELIKTLETMAKQVGGGGDDGDPSRGSYGDSYNSGSYSRSDGSGERFDDEGYYNEPFDGDNQSFGDDGEYSNDDFDDEGSYGSDYGDE